MGQTVESDWLKRYLRPYSEPRKVGTGNFGLADVLEQQARQCFAPERRAPPSGPELLDAGALQAFLENLSRQREATIERELLMSLDPADSGIAGSGPAAKYVWAGGGMKADWFAGTTSRYFINEKKRKVHATPANMKEYGKTERDLLTSSCKGMDCSGYAMSALKHLGIMDDTVPRKRAIELYDATERVAVGHHRPGDLAFYKGKEDGPVCHVMVVATVSGAGEGDQPWVVGARSGGSQDYGEDGKKKMKKCKLRYWWAPDEEGGKPYDHFVGFGRWRTGS